jgi:hypothetical protein
VRIANDEAGGEAEFIGCEAAGFAGLGFGDTSDFEEHGAGADDGDPGIDSTFTFTHPGFGRARGDGFVWEDADVDFAFPFEVAGDGDPAGFDLAGRHPSATDALEAEISESNGVSDLGIPGAASAVAFAELGSFGHQWHGEEG